MGQPVPEPFKVEKRSSVFPTSHITVETPALLIHISLNFCKTGPGMKKGIVPTCLFKSLQPDICFSSGPALMGRPSYTTKRCLRAFLGNVAQAVTD